MKATGVLKQAAYRVDHLIGDGLERLMCAHHRRRLHRLGWVRALDPPAGLWASGDPPPRPGSAMEVLIDGAEAVPRIAEAIRDATSHVHIAGWYLSVDFRLGDGHPHPTLRELLAEVAERLPVRVLLWAGAPVPPVRRRVLEVGDELNRQAAIHFAVDSHARALHCHHEKTIVVDDEVAFVGGIDLTTRSGDRFDSSEHPPRGELGWHDASARLEGPIVSDVSEHFRMRWKEVTGETLPAHEPSEPAGDVTAQIVRTIPERVYGAVPRGDFRALESYVRALYAAERLIYLENQFLWSPEIIEILRAKLRDPPTDRFRLLVVLPSKPRTGADDTIGQLATLAEVDADANRFLACTLYARSEQRSDPVYVHAKIGIVDDAWLTIGSVNLNEHSLFNDTEVNVVTCDARLASETRRRLWAEHLEVAPSEVDGDPATLIDTMWQPIAEEQLRRRESGAPLTHRVARLPHVSKRAKRVLGPVQGLFVDG